MGRKGDNFDGVCKKYSPESITKKTWGNSVWYFIHFLAIRQADGTQRVYYKRMMHSLAFLLPCEMCREHLQSHLRDVPIDGFMSSNERLFEWTVILHNVVNRSLGKPVMGVVEARKLYV
jgi:hypothetical protein